MSKKLLYRDIKQLRNKQPARYTPIEEQKELTPLQALEELSELAITPDLKVLPKFDGWTRLEVMNRYKPIIEKTLKAVDIIRKKKVDLDYLLKGLPNLESYNKDRVPRHQLTEEEHDLIYDVFTESISAESWLGAVAELNDPDLPKGE